MPNFYRHHKLQYWDSKRRKEFPKEFRILKLHGGPPNAKIVCEIQHYPLPESVHQDASVKYEALSWTWGDDETNQSDTPTIIISGGGAGGEDKEFPVKRNLKSALEHLRWPTQPRNLWIDFVCINQDDLAERAAQVKQMFFIYSKATNVCVWLGEQSDNSTIAMKFIEQVNDLKTWTKSTEEHNKDKWAALAALMDRKWFSRRWVVQELALAKKATVHCSESWVDWTAFETAVALFNRDAAMLSGYFKGSKDANFDHDFFGDVAQMGATRLVHLKSNLFRLNESGDIIDYRLTLMELVSELWSFNAQDPHDLIYAILSIAKDTREKVNVPPRYQVPIESPPSPSDGSATPGAEASQALPLQLSGREAQLGAKVAQAFRHAKENPRTVFHIDYEQDFFHVCKQFLSHVIPDGGMHNLDIVLRPWSPFQDKRGRRIELPSWIPTLEKAAFKRQEAQHAPGGYQMKRQMADPLVGQGTHGPRGSPYNACHSRKALPDDWQLFESGDIENDKDRSLLITGYVLDRVSSLQDASQHGNVPQAWLVLGGWLDQFGQECPASDVLWRTLVADRGPAGATTMPYYHKAFQQAVRDSASGINSNVVQSRGHPVLSEFLTRMMAVVCNRRLFKGKQTKHLGLAPLGAESGDYVCIIRGMSVPVILRLVEDSEPPLYKMIGGCYLHTMMDGGAAGYQEQTTERLNTEVLKTTARISEIKESITLAEAQGRACSDERKRLRGFEQTLTRDQETIADLATQKFELR